MSLGGADQSGAPYLEALQDYAERNPGRFHVPGHKGGQGADPGLREAIGERALALRTGKRVIGLTTWELPREGIEPAPNAEAAVAQALGGA